MTLRLRSATESDENLLLEWANDPTVRERAFHTDQIPLAEHRRWFRARLTNPAACRIFVGEQTSGEPVGQIRFDRENTDAVISFSVARDHRGHGYGVELLREGCRQILALWPDTQEIRGLVKADNLASRRAFERAGFSGEVAGGVCTFRHHPRGAWSNSLVASRLVLGTVQLGVAYGRQRGRAVMTVEQATTILDGAWERGVRAFDTAEAYGDAADRLSRWLRDTGRGAEARVVTKIAPDPVADAGARAAAAIRRFADVAEVCLLTHGPADQRIWHEVLGTADQWGAPAGQSLYDALEVRRGPCLAGIRRIQVPGNVLSLDAVHARGDHPVPVDVRSVYLQGVLLDVPAVAEQRVPGAGLLAQTVAQAAAECGIGPAPLLAAAVLQALRESDRIVVGVDRESELDALMEIERLDPIVIDEFLASVRASVPEFHDPRVLDPRQWPVAVPEEHRT